jgi:hypothetical protein
VRKRAPPLKTHSPMNGYAFIINVVSRRINGGFIAGGERSRAASGAGTVSAYRRPSVAHVDSSTCSRNSLPVLKKGSLFSVTDILAPVLGFLPV